MADSLRMPGAASRKRLVIALNSPKSRYKDGTRDAIKLQFSMPADQMTDRHVALVEQIERLMFEFMKPEASPDA